MGKVEVEIKHPGVTTGQAGSMPVCPGGFLLGGTEQGVSWAVAGHTPQPVSVVREHRVSARRGRAR